MRAVAQQGAGALLCMASPVFFRQRAELGEAAIANRMPAIGRFAEAAENGMLISYGATCLTRNAAPPTTSTASSRALDRRTCRWSSRPSSS